MELNSSEGRDYVSEVFGMLRKPRSICICDDCRPSRQAPDDLMGYLQCANCYGWVSQERIFNDNLAIYPLPVGE